MTNKIAIGLVLLIVGGLAADMIWLESKSMLFLARRFAELIEWLAFWR